MGLIPIYAWTFFFLFFVIILGYNSLRQAKARKIAALDLVKASPFVAGYKAIPTSFQADWTELQSASWLDINALLKLANLTNELNWDDSEWISLLKNIKNYQVTFNTYKHLLRYQPTRTIAGILRWA
jgi:hypothetical protein